MLDPLIPTWEVYPARPSSESSIVSEPDSTLTKAHGYPHTQTLRTVTLLALIVSWPRISRFWITAPDWVTVRSPSCTCSPATTAGVAAGTGMSETTTTVTMAAAMDTEETERVRGNIGETPGS